MRDKLASAARDKMKEKSLQAERKRKAAMFLKMVGRANIAATAGSALVDTSSGKSSPSLGDIDPLATIGPQLPKGHISAASHQLPPTAPNMPKVHSSTTLASLAKSRSKSRSPTRASSVGAFAVKK